MKGLMFRKSLREKEGLLMVFPKPAKLGIWMLFTKFPIDVVFLDERWRVVDIKEDLPPVTADPRTWRVYNPQKKASYVLEVAAGSLRENRIKEGARLLFSRRAFVRALRPWRVPP